MPGFLQFLTNDTAKKILFVVGATAGATSQVLPSHTIGAQVSGLIFTVLASLGIVSSGTAKKG